MTYKKVKGFLLSFFREFFLYHHISLEYRAKLFATMIASQDDTCAYEKLQEIAKDIYKDDEYRVDVLVHTTKEYVSKIHSNDALSIDHLLIDIDNEGKKNRRFIEKINMDHLKSLYCDNSETNIQILQTRILEFFENQIASLERKTSALNMKK